MKQGLALRFGQQQVLAPQLQQAIRMLQLSAEDLQLEVQAALESNPMLEPDEAEGELLTANGEEPEAPDLDLEQVDVIPEDLPIDAQWEDLYQTLEVPKGPAAPDCDPLEWTDAEGSLQDHLRWQLNPLALPAPDHDIALVIIDAINADGVLMIGIEDILASFDPALGINTDAVSRVLDIVQQFDPPGVAARSVAESLSLQLQQLAPQTPWRDEAIGLVENHLQLLAAKDFAALKRATGFSEGALAQINSLIEVLNPRPGAAHSVEPTRYFIPDVLVRKQNGRWTVGLNPESLPRVRVREQYAALVKCADNSRDNLFLRNSLTEARWFLKCLRSRHETLLKVAAKIVEVQQGFLEQGERAMKPLVLRDIAEAVDMHDSTISRVVSRKCMHTPRGVFELKYFFSSHVSTSTGQEVSSTAIRALIRNLIKQEGPKKPLSDSKIAAMLAERSFKVARRTVAKYRESMAIPPSSKRKRLA